MTDPTAHSARKSGAGVLELLRLFESDQAAADRYASACLEKANAVEPALKAFEYFPVDTARRPGLLSGIPVAIKDIIATSDMPTVSTEFAWRHPGPTVNPWNRNHTPGGSSSGSAAAVAAGIVPLALGTQTLGSVIRPAAFNGVVGLKPSFGAIPRIGVHPLSPSLDHVGFFARRVDDVALALSLLAGSSDRDLHGRPLPPFHIDIDNGLHALDKPRLAVMRFGKWSRAEVEQQKAFEAAIEKSRDAGAIVQELELSELDRANWEMVNTILASEAAVIFADLVTRYPDRTSDHLKSLVESGNAVTATDYLAAKALQEQWRNAFPKQISGYDAILTLPAFGEAPLGLHSTGDAEYCAPWTLLGVPAVTLPVGFGRHGLPLGIQIVGEYRNDLRLLRVAKWIETVLSFDPGSPKRLRT
jgi:Asp-tRNA(Asn)/Glu-tRNA(Gln) amidotransferase A subunit family amidase